MGFTTPSYSLTDLFARIDRGELQIPDFQHTYLWDVDRTRTLISSVLRGYPVGTLLALDTRNEPMRFKPRTLPGAPETDNEPGLLLLDGQQRLASLYLALQGDGRLEVLDFRQRRIHRRYFVDVRAAVRAEPIPEEAIFAVDDEGVIRSHFGPDIPGGITDRQTMVDNYVVPVSALLWEEGNDLLFDMAANAEDPSLREDVKAFHRSIVRPLAAYDLPMTRLERGTSQIGVGQIFAQANSQGVSMDVFELLTAVFALESPDFSLAAHWEECEGVLHQYPALRSVTRVRFLRGVSLLVSGMNGFARGHRGDILNLKLDEYLWASRDLLAAFERAAQFLSDRCIFSVDQVPYNGQLVPLAVILARLSYEDGCLDNPATWDRINQWYWSGVFGELYGAHSPSIRAGSDVDQVTPWAKGETEVVPKTVQDAEFVESRLITADEDSGVYRGLFSLLMARGARDWRTGKLFDGTTVAELQPGFYQVFPPGFCRVHNVDPQLAASVLNRTPLGKRTESVMEGNDPKRYLSRLQSKAIMEDDEFDALLATHEIEPEYLLTSNWQAFFADRHERFLGMIEYAMNKPAQRDRV
ncbi:DUF262 domain-containing protein [Corynebacterium genitalium ATCC 33030]|uniref:GmrSD restriction endonucleases N-terminal domain-containing protein n=1 Tax=Corynebacterium genitalium ATCC 33030 TaxID=585529 RepID=D7WD87_9CORY|nr:MULTISPECIES: DUF262 domain-containing protein [Corynebacterium]EFK54118.1 hypothetical protein HMPREF0291_11775 [Corynebacterium genitalium ATCC 33030]MCQ4625059.1 DUF262 domain-containing protein [Corynebacterium sp. CCUG 69979]MCQ4627561.1 DUF262 domain-containing protein [Corynebacterium sp. CCUG 65737]UUA90347.1 DUF262 domain-containing protein [Corynebacterium genitalium ATCC 33030]